MGVEAFRGREEGKWRFQPDDEALALIVTRIYRSGSGVPANTPAGVLGHEEESEKLRVELRDVPDLVSTLVYLGDADAARDAAAAWLHLLGVRHGVRGLEVGP